MMQPMIMVVVPGRVPTPMTDPTAVPPDPTTAGRKSQSSAGEIDGIIQVNDVFCVDPVFAIVND